MTTYLDNLDFNHHTIKKENNRIQEDDYEDINEPELKAELRNGSELITYSEAV